ncbi:MAG: hypothetical protein ACXWHZ_00840, partial [Usitatibacter sp.]
AGDDKGESIVKFHSLRSTLAGLAALGAALLLSSCGGGGAAGNPNQGGPISVSPANGTFYAGVPSTITLQGGRKPYSVTSSDPSVLPVPAIVNGNSFDVIPNNPGVVDPGLQAGELPRKTVVISVRDTTGILVTASIAVGQNFLTGYGLSLTPTTCPAPTTGSPPSACAGGETAIQMRATFAGSIGGDRVFTLQVIRGNFTLKNPVTGAVGTSITVNSDHAGMVTGLIEVPAGTPTQLAVIRITDAATGVYSDQVFVISGVSATAGLTAIPNTIDFTGATSTQCGTGSADVLIFDGAPPYTATSTNPQNLIVTPLVSDSQPGRFTIQAINPNICLATTVVVTDSRGGRATIAVTTKLGTGTTPTLKVSPDAITLGCAQSGAVSVVGGSGNYSVNSTNSAIVTGGASGNTLLIARAGPAGAGAGTTTTTLSVTDGADIVTVDVTSPLTCP